MDFFGPSSPVAPLLEKATDPGLLTPDWHTVMQIHDMLDSQTPDEVISAFKLIRKKLGNKNPKVVMLALTVVDSCVQNGDFKVHKVVASKAFMGAMSALAQGKRGADVAGEAARLIQKWGVGFESIKDALPGFYETYQTLKSKGVSFPSAPKTEAPIFTPPPSAVAAAPGPAPAAGNITEVMLMDGSGTPQPGALSPPPGVRSRGGNPSTTNTGLHHALTSASAPAPAPTPAPAPAEPVSSAFNERVAALADEYVKLHSDLNIVQRTCGRFATMLLEGVNPTTDPWLDAEDFLEQCRSRMHALVQAGSAGALTEEAFAQILETNDMLVKVLARAQTGTGATDDDLANVAAIGNAVGGMGDVGDGAGAGAGAGDDGGLDDLFSAAPVAASAAAPAPAVAASAPAPAPAPAASSAVGSDLAGLFGSSGGGGGGSGSAPAPAPATAAVAADDPFLALAQRGAKPSSTIRPTSGQEAAALLANMNLDVAALGLAPASAAAPAPATAATTMAPPQPPAPPAASGQAAPPPVPPTVPGGNDGAQAEVNGDVDDFEAFLNEQAEMLGGDVGTPTGGDADLAMDELDAILSGGVDDDAANAAQG